MPPLAGGVRNWRDGWCSSGLAQGRTCDVFVHQLDHLVERSCARVRRAVALCDNARILTPQGAKAVREALERHGANLRLIPTPAYDPTANRTERFWQLFRRRVTHNHHRDDVVDLYCDGLRYFADLDERPRRVLRHVGSPFAIQVDRAWSAA